MFDVFGDQQLTVMADLAEDHENQLKYLRCGHSDHLLKSINRLRKERKLCDITLKVGEKEFFAHRVILSACSDYFCAMFTGNMEESHKSVVELHGLDSDTMEFILDFVYTETIQVSVENVQALLPAACLLQLTGLFNSCLTLSFPAVTKTYFLLTRSIQYQAEK